MAQQNLEREIFQIPDPEGFFRGYRRSRPRISLPVTDSERATRSARLQIDDPYRRLKRAYHKATTEQARETLAGKMEGRRNAILFEGIPIVTLGSKLETNLLGGKSEPVEGLTPCEATIIRLRKGYYGDGKTKLTRSETARILGISRRTVVAREKRAKMKFNPQMDITPLLRRE